MTPDIARLREFVEAAKAPGDLPWAMIEEDAARWLAEHGDSLLAIAEAYAGAPEAEISAVINSRFVYVETDDDTFTDDHYEQRVRLVRVPE